MRYVVFELAGGGGGTYVPLGCAKVAQTPSRARVNPRRAGVRRRTRRAGGRLNVLGTRLLGNVEKKERSVRKLAKKNIRNYFGILLAQVNIKVTADQ